MAQLTQPYAETCQWLECDGLTRVLHRVLFDAGIQHKVYFGNVVVWYPQSTSGVETGAEATVDSPGQRSTVTKVVPNHFWIELEGVGSGSDCCLIVVDYRLLWWVLGGKDRTLPLEYAEILPHGVFNPANYPQVEYQRAAIVDEPVIGDAVFAALTNVEFNTVLPTNFFSR